MPSSTRASRQQFKNNQLAMVVNLMKEKIISKHNMKLQNETKKIAS